jgi:hypothetical protein
MTLMLLASLVLAAAVAAPRDPASSAPLTVAKAARLIDGTGKAPRDNVGFVLQGGVTFKP